MRRTRRVIPPCDWVGAVPTGEILLLDRVAMVVVYTYGGGGDDRLPTPTCILVGICILVWLYIPFSNPESTLDSLFLREPYGLVNGLNPVTGASAGLDSSCSSCWWMKLHLGP